MKILVSNPYIQTLRSDKSARIVFDLDDPSQFGEALDFAFSANGSYRLSIEPADEDGIPYLDEIIDEN